MDAFHWETVPPVKVHPGVTRQQIDATNCTIVRYLYAPGAQFPEHTHEQEQVTIVLRGPIQFTVEGVSKLYHPGEILIIPPNAVHAARAATEQAAEIIAVIAPARRGEPV